MLFGRVTEPHNEANDSQLLELERELKNKIERAKNLANSLQSSSDSE